MLKHLPAINKTMKGMGTLMDNQRPVVRFMAQNWPLAMITGYALYRRLNKRRKDRSLTTFTALTDAGMVFSPLAVVAIISMAANKQTNQAPAIAQQRPIGLPAPSPEVHVFACEPPPAFFATRPPHEVNAAIPAPAEEVITAPGAPPSAPSSGSGGPFDSFLS